MPHDPSRLEADLHVHTIGCYHPEDLFALARDHFRDINWNRFGFLDRYREVFGVSLDPVAVFERARSTGSLDEIEDIAVYRYHPAGRFEEFDVKSFFAIAITGYYLDRGEHEPILAPIVGRHRREGLTYVEYRNAFAAEGEEFKEWHGRYARFLRDASDDGFAARYIVRMTGRDPLVTYKTLRELLEEQPDLVGTIVGVDFSGREIPPRALAEFYERVRRDNRQQPETALDVVVHIGENFYDLSLESAIRWCHESALFGARRLAHCIALGLDPAVAVARRERAHERETVRERLDQIDYDLAHAAGLHANGVPVDAGALERERRDLLGREPDEPVDRGYDDRRLVEASSRQDYVLRDLARLGTVIETCPTSNLCIGGVPDIASHPFRKLYASDVNLAVCTDDPGIFGITLATELGNVRRWFDLPEAALRARLGDPRRFRLSLGRNRASPSG